MLDPQQGVGAAFDPQPDLLGRVEEVRLDVLRHEPAFLAGEVTLAHPLHVNVPPGQRDAGGLLVLLVLLGGHAVDLRLGGVDAGRVEQGVLDQPLEVDAVEGEQVADDVVDAPLQRGLHRLQLGVQPFEQLPLDRVGGAEVEDVAVVLLADPVHPAHPLLEPHRVPRQVVVDHQVAELEVDPLPGCFGGDADLLVQAEVLLDLLAFRGRDAAVDRADRVAPLAQVVLKVGQGVTVLGEDQQPAAAVFQLAQLGLLQAGLERGELAFGAHLPDPVGVADQLPQLGHLGPQRLDLLRAGHSGGELVLGPLVNVVVADLRVTVGVVADLRHAPELRQPPAAFGGGHPLQLIGTVREPLGPLRQRGADRAQARGKTALQHRARECDGRPAAACRRRAEVRVDVAGDRVVQLLLGRRELERLGLDVTRHEELVALLVDQVLLLPPQEVRITVLRDLPFHQVRRRELVWVQQAQEPGEAVLVA